MVYDTYLEKTLKGITLEKRRRGTRRKVTSASLVPSDWKGFLRVDGNKTELFRFVSREIFKLDDDITSAFDDTIASKWENMALSPTDHKEADIRLFLHVKDRGRKGLSQVRIRTVDTDMFLLSISLYDDLDFD